MYFDITTPQKKNFHFGQIILRCPNTSVNWNIIFLDACVIIFEASIRKHNMGNMCKP